MKILLISSSPHRAESKTLLLAQEVARGCGQKEAETETIYLGNLKIGFCRHCEACHKKILACPIKDDVPMILTKMLEADGIILASPNYINQVTASMKALFDRSSHFIHCLRLTGKHVVGVVSSGSGWDKAVLDYLQYYTNGCGAWYSGGVSSQALTVPEALPEANALGKRLAADITEKSILPDQERAIGMHKKRFRKIIALRKDEWVAEYQYWLDKNWL
ncbi:MAG: flavodoxin family protein [Candidatus Omnitrophota bacterium]